MRVRALGWGWRHVGRTTWAVRGLDLSIAPGERVLLTGRSGAGKSTLLRALAGLLDPAHNGEQEGALLLDEQPPIALRRQLALLQQDPSCSLVQSRIGPDIAFGPLNVRVAVSEVRERRDEALAAVGLAGHDTARDVDRLSGGQRQRVALAGVLALRPALLLLDEPTALLDPRGRDLVLAALGTMDPHRRTTVVLVEHNGAAVRHLVDREIALRPPQSLLAVPTVPWHDLARPVPEPGALPAADGRRQLPQLSSEPVLSLRQISVRRQGPHGELRSPEPAIDLELRPGTATVIVGPNGSGKTTLALVAAGLLRPDRGDVIPGPPLLAAAALPDQAPSARIRRQPWGARRHSRAHTPLWRWRSPQLAAAIGTVLQNPEHTFCARQVRAEMLLGLPDSAAVKEHAQELLEQTGLAHLQDADPFTLSGGEQRRLSVAVALMRSPALLIVDEPTFGQDQHSALAIVKLLLEVRERGTALLVVTHDQGLVQQLADVVVELELPSADRDENPAEPAARPADAYPGERTAPTRIHPLARLGSAGALSVAAVLLRDPVSMTVILALGMLLGLPGALANAGAGRTARLLLAPLVGAAGASLANALTVPTTTVPGALLPASVALGLGLGLRVLAISVPGVLAITAVDPADLVECLHHQAAVPERPAFAALAALRLLPALATDSQQVKLARRARGLTPAHLSPATIRLFAGQLFALLVQALRRATRLATAMEGRAFGTALPGSARPWLDPWRWRSSDSALLLATALALAALVLVGANAHTLRPIWG